MASWLCRLPASDAGLLGAADGAALSAGAAGQTDRVAGAAVGGMDICTESAAQLSSTGGGCEQVVYEGAWIGGASRRIPAKEPLGLGSERHLSLFPAGAAHTSTMLQQEHSSTGGDEIMGGCAECESLPQEAMAMSMENVNQMSTPTGASGRAGHLQQDA